jgi:hypothetical protein
LAGERREHIPRECGARFRFHRSGKLSGIVLLSARFHRDQHRTIKLLATVDAAIVSA